MTHARFRIAIIILVLIVLVLASLLVRSSRELEWHRLRPSYSDSDQDIVDLAYQITSRTRAFPSN
jgi:hypothetical protein